ncbi:Ger(x)C family spore germination protein [Paenibacillus sp. ACRRX]|uniref:Ger(x)C family spore germination protein n=1 Tax=Paenibacillus sp. ACRRX TaxID=2918206 RepID=UPI001EF3F4FA|nr:Ger(x)C family spore germination protein [Paenibacillus sp. ACRRX]MCG7406883.1 Ger(x)C family spore germination protein [Paenibacillus sp. ACRRX]
MNRSWLLITVMSLVTLGITGCWSKMEINDRSFVSGLFIDVTDIPGEVELTMVTPLPNRFASMGQSSGTESASPVAIISEKADSLPEAFRKIQGSLTRKLTWGQTKVIVLGRKYAEKGIEDLVEWGARQQSFQLKSYLFVAEGKAKDITRLSPIYEQSPSEVLREFANRRMLLNTRLKDVLQSISDHQGLAVNLLQMKFKTMISEPEKQSLWVVMNGAAMLQSTKMIGTLSESETRGVGWVYRSLKDPQYTVKLREGKCSLNIHHNKASIKPILQEGSQLFRIKMTAGADIIAADTRVDITKAEVLHSIEQAINDKLIADLRSALSKSQQVKADVLQLGSYLEWWYPAEWSRLKPMWPDYYKDKVRFDIQAHVEIKHYNGELKPIWNLK